MSIPGMVTRQSRLSDGTVVWTAYIEDRPGIVAEGATDAEAIWNLAYLMIDLLEQTERRRADVN